MIQRIQTIYLFIGLILMGITIFLPFAEILTGQGEIYLFTSKGVHYFSGEEKTWIFHSWPVMILILVIVILFAIILVFYRWRKLQMRICIYNMLLQIGLLGLLYYYMSVIFRKMSAVEYSYRLAVILPVISIILTYLAYRGIRKDDILIRSMDKIR